MFLIIYGDPLDGFNAIGPFEDSDQACNHAEGIGESWWLMKVPDKPNSPKPTHLLAGGTFSDGFAFKVFGNAKEAEIAQEHLDEAGFQVIELQAP